MELNGSTPGQKAMKAADSVVRRELGISDAVLVYGTTHSSLNKALAIKQRDDGNKVASDIRLGKITLAEGARRVGLSTSNTPLRSSMQFSRGDKWLLATEPLRRYMRTWAGKEYTHINPKEARRRLKIVREMQEGLRQIEADLEPRSKPATLTAGREGDFR